MTARATAIGHIEADCFYVSAGRVRDEILERRPVGVLENQTADPVPRPSYDAGRSWLGTCRRGILETPTSE